MTSNMRVYPNPIKDVLKVQCSTKGASIQLLDMMGRVVSMATLNSGVTEIDTRQLVAGVYLLRIKMIDGGVYAQKILRQ